jgi:uncharacterized protein with PQ loop repeat
MIFSVFGDKILAYFQIPQPALYIKLKAKKLIVLGGVIFLGMALSNYLGSTGVLEITLDHNLIYSKLPNSKLLSTFELNKLLLTHIASD